MRDQTEKKNEKKIFVTNEEQKFAPISLHHINN